MSPSDPLQMRATLSAPRFTERHLRVLDLPIDEVWPACLTLTSREVRTAGPLMAVRGLPARLGGGGSSGFAFATPLLDSFEAAGFVRLRRDAAASRGRAVALLGAAGRFWSPAHNRPVTFSSAQPFLDFEEPGHAKAVVSLEAADAGRGRTVLQTRTWVRGTDARAHRSFAAYWMLIRPFSGLIRHSWLAAIERRARLR